MQNVPQTKGLFTRSKFSIKNLVTVFFVKVLWSCKPASKTLSKIFDGFWQTWHFDWLDQQINQKIFSESRSFSHFVCFWIYRRKVKTLMENFDHVKGPSCTLSSYQKKYWLVALNIWYIAAFFWNDLTTWNPSNGFYCIYICSNSPKYKFYV